MRKHGLDLEYLQFSNFRVHQNHWESLLKLRFVGLKTQSFCFSQSGVGPRICISNWESQLDSSLGVPEFAFLTSSQMMLMLLDQG